MPDFPESDWKLYVKLRPLALERLCHRILGEVVAAATAPSQTDHEGYLALWKLLNDRNKDIARAFDGLDSRAQAFRRITEMRSLDLFTEEEFSGFSEETKGTIAFLLKS